VQASRSGAGQQPPSTTRPACAFLHRDGNHRDNFGESLEICQLSSHNRGFLSKCIGPSLWISLAHKTPSYGKKIILKVVFDKTMFVKFKINNNLKQNTFKSTKNLYQTMDLKKSQEKNPRTKSL
jgi:hypothetical protein